MTCIFLKFLVFVSIGKCANFLNLQFTLKTPFLTYIMDNPLFSNVITSTELLPHFDSQSVTKFKQRLLKELECKDEKEFLCVVMKGLYQTMSNQSLNTLKNEAIQLAQEQKTQSENGQVKSLYDLIATKYTDILSRLPSSAIDIIGSCLTKHQSIRLGFLNKMLLKETQKISYLLARKHDQLVLDDRKIGNLSYPTANPFHYSLPTHLVLNISTSTKQDISSIATSSYAGILKSKWFKSLFSRLKSFKCNNYDILQYIPINILFDNNSYYTYHKHCNGEYIDLFSITQSVYEKNFDTLMIPHKIKAFTQRVKQYANHKANCSINFPPAKDHGDEEEKNTPQVLPKERVKADVKRALAPTTHGNCRFKNIRKICNLQVSLKDARHDASAMDDFMNIRQLAGLDRISNNRISRSDAIKHMLCNLSGMYYNIFIDYGFVHINTIDELCQIFSKRVNSINLGPYAMINIRSRIYVTIFQTLFTMNDEELGHDHDHGAKDNDVRDNERKILMDKLELLSKHLRCITITSGGIGDPNDATSLNMPNLTPNQINQMMQNLFNGQNITNNVLSNYEENKGSTLRLLDALDRCGLRKNISNFKINFCDGVRDIVDLVSCHSNAAIDNEAHMLAREQFLFDKIFFKDYHIYPNLDTITIVIHNETVKLTKLTKVFTYLMGKKDELASISYANNGNNGVRAIEIEWKDIYNDQLQWNSNPLQIGNFFYIGTNSIFSRYCQSSNSTYGINDMIIDWNNCNFTLNSFGIMFENIRHWFNRIYLHSRKRINNAQNQNGYHNDDYNHNSLWNLLDNAARIHNGEAPKKEKPVIPLNGRMLRIMLN